MKRLGIALFLLILTPCFAFSAAPTNEEAASAVKDAFVRAGKTVSSVTVAQIGAAKTEQTSKGPILYWPVTASVVERAGTKKAEGVVFVMPAGVSFDKTHDGLWNFQKDVAALKSRIDQGDPQLISANGAAEAKGKKAKLAQEVYFVENSKFTCNLNDLLKIEPHLTEGGTLVYEFSQCDEQKYAFSVRHVSGTKSYQCGN
jgi:hypothetical protein